MNLGRIFTQAVVRRIAYLVVAAACALVASLFSSNAKAQNLNTCPNSTPRPCTQGQAYTASIDTENFKAYCRATTYTNVSAYPTIRATIVTNVASTDRYNTDFRCAYLRTTDNTWQNAPTNTPMTAYWNPNGTCALTAPSNQGPFTVKGSNQTCFSGCAYEMDSPVSVCMGEGAAMYCYAPTWKPTGQGCSTGMPAPSAVQHDPTKETCTATGSNYKECVKPDGQHCVTGAKGSVLCWQPGETGTRQTGDGSLAAARAIAPATPAISTAIQNPTTVANTTTTINNTTYNTTTATGTGSSGGQANLGTGGRTGNGTGTTDGTGQGTGDGEGEGDDDDGGEAGPGVGELYDKSDKTVESIVEAWWAVMQETPIFDQINVFFGNCGYSGACPNWSYESTYTGPLSFTQLCDGTIGELLQYAGFIIMAVAAWAAFKVGFY